MGFQARDSTANAGDDGMEDNLAVGDGGIAKMGRYCDEPSVHSRYFEVENDAHAMEMDADKRAYNAGIVPLLRE